MAVYSKQWLVLQNCPHYRKNLYGKGFVCLYCTCGAFIYEAGITAYIVSESQSTFGVMNMYLEKALIFILLLLKVALPCLLKRFRVSELLQQSCHCLLSARCIEWGYIGVCDFSFVKNWWWKLIAEFIVRIIVIYSVCSWIIGRNLKLHYL